MSNHRFRRRLLIAIGVVVVLAIVGPFVFIHFIEGPTAPKLALPSNPKTGTTGASAVTADTGGVAGTWSVGEGSVAGYRVEEILLGQHTTAVGRTSAVTGELRIVGTTVVAARFTVEMAKVESDQSQRNAQFDGRIMNVSQYPTATFTLTSPIAFGSVPAIGKTIVVTGSGTLAMHGVTHRLAVVLSAERLGSTIDVLADAKIVFSTWDIANPSVGGFVTTASTGTLEVLLHLSKGASPSETTTTLGSSSGSPGQVTIPATTVPPLSVPTSN